MGGRRPPPTRPRPPTRPPTATTRPGELVSTTTPATTAAPTGRPPPPPTTRPGTCSPQPTPTASPPPGPTRPKVRPPPSPTPAHPRTRSANGYDADGNKTAMTDATGSSSYAYDPFGELTSTTNGAGQTVGYGYDADGEITGITYPLPASATWATSRHGQLRLSTTPTCSPRSPTSTATRSRSATPPTACPTRSASAPVRRHDRHHLRQRPTAIGDHAEELQHDPAVLHLLRRASRKHPVRDRHPVLVSRPPPTPMTPRAGSPRMTPGTGQP